MTFETLYSSVVTLNSLFLWFQVTNQLQEVVSRRRERLYAMGESMQPMVVLVGEVTAVNAAYVVLPIDKLN